MNNFVDETYKRVEQIMNANNLNIKTFEEKVGVSNNSIGTAIRRKASFKSNVLNKILNAFPEVDPAWLLTGKGTMLLKDNNFYSEEPDAVYKNEKLDQLIKTKLIRLLSEDENIKDILLDYIQKEVKNL
ncbi:hypothetical protein [Tenacibaculum amylolyticum]|uniref:hypothetical protein n=1 Tax=Tenacibaculum amylolyticum TaxID=104269 RepID=UPI003895291E